MKRSVLVVDDDDILLRSLKKVLQRTGKYDVHVATTVESALATIDGTDVSAAVVDYALARETGLAVLSKLMLVQPRCVRILMTGRSDTAIFVDAVNHGEVAKVIRKPFPGSQLLTALDDAFETAARMRRVATEINAEEAEAARKALDQAVRPELLGMALQPIVELDGESVHNMAYEALLRPRHERLNNPMALLASAERQDRLLEVTSTLLLLARRCLDRVPDGAALFINLHPAQLGYPDRLMSDLEPFRAHADRITLEITERSRLQDIERWEESVTGLTSAGFSIAVDDLGAGYASLGMLADLDPDYIKLDMSLVRNVHVQPRKQRLVRMLQTFGAATGAKVIAEGVENKEEMLALRDSGITLMQGYFWARPKLEI